MSDKIRILQSFIDGQPAGCGEPTLEIRNPGNLDEVVALVDQASDELARQAMNAAAESLKEWAITDLTGRRRVLSKALDLLEEESETMAETITRENGKTLNEARSEVEASLRDGRYQIEVLGRHRGIEEIPISDISVECSLRYEPVGVFLLITPWNFPLATIVRKMVPALGFGNTVVCKPAEITPCSAFYWFDMLRRAGLPDGVANLVLGKSSEIGKSLIEHPRLGGISFTGSTGVGLGLCQQTVDRPIHVQMEMGGKNALVVLSDADLREAVEATVTAAFSCAGQWCTSTSRVVVERAVYEEYLKSLILHVRRIRLGPGDDPETGMGPVISEQRREECLRAIQKAEEEGANLAIGGKAIDTINGKRGCFLEPTVFSDVSPEMQLAKEEVFGPVLAVIPVSGPEEALRVVNDTQYGLTFSVFTSSEETADRFMDHVEAGVCHVNLHTAYRRAEAPIGGWRQSGRGIPECGDVQKQLYTRIKTVYRRKR